MEETNVPLRKALENGKGGIHWYGKASARKGRKMAHCTFVGGTLAAVQRDAESIGVATVRRVSRSGLRRVSLDPAFSALLIQAPLAQLLAVLVSSRRSVRGDYHGKRFRPAHDEGCGGTPRRFWRPLRNNDRLQNSSVSTFLLQGVQLTVSSTS